MVLLMAMVAIASVSVLPIAVAAAEEGPCAQWGSRGPIQSIGRRTISIPGSSDVERTVPVDIWYPAIDTGEADTQYLSFLPSQGESYVALDNPAAASPSSDDGHGFPLLVFSHGFQGYRFQSASLMEHLASWGFVVAAPDHADKSREADGLRERPRDVSLVIDTMLSSPYVEEFHLHGGVDGGVGVVGYSVGGWTSLMLAAEGRPTHDGRIRAVVPIAPTVCLEEWDCDYLPNVTAPALMIAAANETSSYADPYNEVTFEKAIGLPRWNLIVRGADHLDFTDLCNIFGAIVSLLGEDMTYTLLGNGDIERGKSYLNQVHCENYDEIHAITRHYATSFFRTMLLLGDDDNEGRDAAMKCMAEQAEDFDLLMRLDILQGGLEKEDEGEEEEHKEVEDKEEEGEGEEEDNKTEENKDVIKDSPDVTDSKSEVASRLSAEEEDEEDEKTAEEKEDKVEDGEEEEDKAEENKDVIKGSQDVTDSKSELVSRSSAEEQDEEEGGEGEEGEEVEDEQEEGKADEDEEDEGNAEEDKDVINGSRDVTDSKSEVESTSSAEHQVEEDEEEEGEIEEEKGEEEEGEAEEDVDGVNGSPDVTDSKSEVASTSSAEQQDKEDEEEEGEGEIEEEKGEEEESEAEEDTDGVNVSLDITDSKGEVASTSSAGEEAEEDEEDKEGKEDKEEEEESEDVEGKAEEGTDVINGSPDVTDSKSEVASRSSAGEEAEEHEEEEDKGEEEEHKAEEGNGEVKGSPGVTDSKSELASKSSAEEEDGEDEEEEDKEDRGEEEVDKAEEGKGGIRGSPDVTDSMSEVAFSKSSPAALPIELDALAQLLMFCVVCMVWYQ